MGSGWPEITMTGDSAAGLVLPVSGPTVAVPALFTAAGEHGVRRLLEWLTAEIRNLNTRTSYKRAIFRFADWCEDQGLRLEAVQPIHAAAYVEQLGRTHAKPT